MDRFNEIYKIVLHEFTDEVAAKTIFAGMQVYAGGIPNTGVHFPSAIVRRGSFGVVEYFISGGTIDFINVIIDIGFPPKNTAITDDAVLYQNDELTTNYGSAIKEFVNRLGYGDVFDSTCGVDKISFGMEPKYAVDGDLQLFGLSVVITIHFEGE